MRIRIIVLGLATCVFLTGCSDRQRSRNFISPAPPSIPSLTLGQLYASPESLVVDGIGFATTVGLWRDYFPNPEGEGSPLQGWAKLKAEGAFPSSMTDVYLWAIRDSSEIWSSSQTSFLDEYWEGSRVYYFWDGPRWGPEILVDVVVGVRTSPSKVDYVLLRNVRIIKTQ
jgi:hypothetical protein